MPKILCVGSTKMVRKMSRIIKQSAKVSENVFLIGMMGSGKTSLGKILAQKLGKVFCDTDLVLEERTGVKVSVIFDIEGEEGFRARESALLDQLTRTSGIVMATGGGVILKKENVKVLRERGVVVFLRATVSDIFTRTMHDKDRPLLQAKNREERILEIYKQREEKYLSSAHVVVDTDDGNLTAIASGLGQFLEREKFLI